MGELDGHNPEALDRDRLNQLTQLALAPGTLFGKGLELTDYDRQQFQIIIDQANAALQTHYEDPAWQDYQDLAQEGADKGVLMSFRNHEGVNVPTWCVDGGDGDDVIVKKVRIKAPDTDETRAGIEVPTRVFNLVHWTNVISALGGYVRSSSDTLRGRSTSELGNSLHGLGVLLGRANKLT